MPARPSPAWSSPLVAAAILRHPRRSPPPSSPRRRIASTRISTPHHHAATRAPSRRRGHGDRRHRRGRRHRPCALGHERACAAPSRLRHQGDDALPAVRAAGKGQAVARRRDSDLRPCRRAGALETRPASGFVDPRRGRHQGGRHQVGQRHRRRRRRGRRRHRGGLRRDDDAQGPCARHEPHALPQRLRPAQQRADHHGFRPRHSRPRHPGAFPALLPLFLAARSRLRLASASTTTTI